MPKSVQLSELQLVLLSTAAAREDGVLLPIAASLGAFDQRIRNSLSALLKRELIDERRCGLGDPVWRADDDGRYGLGITANGLSALNIGENATEPPERAIAIAQHGQANEAAPASQTAKPGSKTALVIDLLSQGEGATLSAICEATGWLAHSARAALTGLRKRGHAITSEKPEGGERAYRIAGGEG